MELTKEFRGDMDLEMKINDLTLENKVLVRNHKMHLEHLRDLEHANTRLRAIEDAHKNINGKLRIRIKRLEEAIKEKDELIRDLYQYP